MNERLDQYFAQFEYNWCRNCGEKREALELVPFRCPVCNDVLIEEPLPPGK